jgi:plastocyanin
MRVRRNCWWPYAFLPALLIGLVLQAQNALGQNEPTDPEEASKELRQIRARMQQLKSALGEAAEFERMSSEAMARAKRILDGEVPEAPAAPELPERPAARTSVAAKVPAVRRRQAPTPAPEPTGSVRGKVAVPSGEPVAYVFVESIRGPAQPGKVTIEQVRKQFVPAWAVVQRGKTVEFPNLDNIYHNVFSLSGGNSFDLGLYAAGEASKSYTFNEAGVVDVYCNIHPNMTASVLVVPNRHFAKVRADGSFELNGVPAGKRKISFWAPGSKLSSDWVTIDPGATTDISLRLESKSSGHTRKDGRPYGSYE